MGSGMVGSGFGGSDVLVLVWVPMWVSGLVFFFFGIGFGIGVCWFWRFWCRFRRSLGGCSVVVPEVSAWDRRSLAAATLSFFCCWGYCLGIFGFVDQF